MKNSFVLDLMKKMTLKEKIGQLYQSSYDGSLITGVVHETKNTTFLLKEGMVGSILGLCDVDAIYKLQKMAVTETKNKIPLLFCNDIIHGCRTILPINLAMSCTWNPPLIEKACKMVADEASHSGDNLTFSPMLDIARDARWGRVMEGNGEDPYLASKMASSYVKGYHKGGIGACAKHYIGYGACVGGRDYAGSEMSISTLFNTYLPPFRQAVIDHCDMVMTSFNTFNDIPSTINSYLCRHILKKKLKYDGVIITDWASLEETIAHGCAKDKKEAAKKGILAGVDHEMFSSCFVDHLEELVKEKEVSESLIDDACYRVLDIKYRLGLFDNPFKNIYANSQNYCLTQNNKEIAYRVSSEAICLLENDGVLPLSKKERVCFVGPFVKETKVIGAWGGKGRFEDTITIEDALQEGKYHYNYSLGSRMYDTDSSLLNEAIDACKDANTIVITCGEEQWMSGESHSRACLDIIPSHDKLIDEVLKMGKKIVLIVFGGRPLVLTKYKKLYEEGKIRAILYAWFLGTMSGKAIVDTLYGKINPSGKTTISFPRAVGQVPIYYNHLPSGRPHIDGGNNDYLLRYIDMDVKPLYPFGYGLSYSKFSYGEVKLSNNAITPKEKLKISVEVANNSSVKGMETIQVYIKAPSGRLSRPVKELKGFKKVSFNAFEKKVVIFDLNPKDLMYYEDEKLVAYDGEYKLFVGPNSDVTDYKKFTLKLNK